MTTGQSERGGFTRVAMPSAAGRLEFVTRAGKAAVMMEESWQTPEQAAARGGSPPPFGPQAGFDPSLVADFKLPGVRAAQLVAKASGFRAMGDLVTATLSPEAAGELLEAEGPPMLPAAARQAARGRQLLRCAAQGPAGLRDLPGPGRRPDRVHAGVERLCASSSATRSSSTAGRRRGSARSGPRRSRYPRTPARSSRR